MSAAAVCSAPRIQCQKATRASRGRVSCSATPQAPRKQQQQQLAGALAAAGALQAAAMAPAAQAAAETVGQVRSRGLRRCRRRQPRAAALLWSGCCVYMHAIVPLGCQQKSTLYVVVSKLPVRLHMRPRRLLTAPA